MGSNIMELKKLLYQRQKEQIPVQTMWAEVVKIDWEAKTMDVKVDDLEIYDVLLGLESITYRPLIGTKCLIGIIENKLGGFLIYAENLESVKLITGESELEQSKNGFSFKKGDESLKDILNDFIDEVNKIVVVQGNTIDKIAVTKIKQRLNTVLK